MSITKRFCQMLGGTVDVVSEPGEGSLFTVSVPLQAPHSPPLEGGPGSTSEVLLDSTPGFETKGTQPTVLVIDDDAAVRELICRLLTKEGFQAISAGSGDEGLALARQMKPDLVSLDVLMPGVDGWSVLKQLKEDADTADIPVVMVSIIDEKKIGYTLGAADFLTKPIDRKQLLKTISRHCGESFTGPVLVVDDDESARELIDSMLSKDGIEVIPAVNGKEGIELLGQRMPQLILLDLMMPVMASYSDASLKKPVRTIISWLVFPHCHRMPGIWLLHYWRRRDRDHWLPCQGSRLTLTTNIDHSLSVPRALF